MPASAGADPFQKMSDVDRLIHEPARFRLMAHLYVVESADFLFLMRQTGLTRGNLSSHMSKLESAGYIEVLKDYIARKPHTMLRLTTKGRSAFREYGRAMKKVFEDFS